MTAPLLGGALYLQVKLLIRGQVLINLHAALAPAEAHCGRLLTWRHLITKQGTQCV